MAKFRKKPVVIEAIQYTGDNLREVLEFTSYQAHVERNRRVFISTLEGVMEATPGDWIIRGIHGEHYPCKPAIFAATYEPAQETSPVQPNPNTYGDAIVAAALACGTPRYDDALANADAARNALIAEIERLRARIAELEKYKLAVEQHNRECDNLCNNAATCGYKQYFDANGRRCPTCPVDMKINVTCNGSGHDT